MSPKDLISVIIPHALTDPRGLASFLSSWTQKQTAPADRFEVIVAVAPGNRSFEEALRRQLRPQDQCLVVEGKSEFHYYDLAVAAAKGKYLLLSEDHCEAAPDCIQKVLDRIDEAELQAATLGSRHINPNRFAELEAEQFQHCWNTLWSDDEHWNHAQVRGFLIQRKYYNAIGGIPWQLKHFSESLIGAHLHRAGIRATYIPEAIVYHHNTTTFSLMQEHVTEYVHGLCRYRESEWLADDNNYFDDPLRYKTESPSGSRMQLVPVAKECFRAFRRLKWGQAVSMAGYGLRRCYHSIAGTHGPLAFAWLKLQYWKCRLCLQQHHASRGRNIYEELWRAYCEHAGVAYFAGTGHYTLAVQQESATQQPTRLDLIATGMHPAENWGDQTFRWSKPIFGLQVPRNIGQEQEIAIHVGRLRDTHSRMRIYQDGKLITGSAIGRFADTLTVRLRQDSRSMKPIELVFFIAPLVAGSGSSRRALGLPIFEIMIRPTSNVTASQAKAA